MANFKTLQMQLLEDVLQMGGGYVLKFSDRTFAEFFREELGVDIDDPKYSVNGGSKGKRMRHFLQSAPQPVVAKALNALWEHRAAGMERAGEKETIPDVNRKMAALIQSIGGTWEHQPASEAPAPGAPLPRASPEMVAALTSQFMALLNVEPQKRGYDFEKFLKELFNAYGLHARDPFRIRGEQIDGSFQLDGATYLLEAKWQSPLTDAADLRAFHGKVEEKAAWSRGLFISYSGFSEDGLFAFGRGKKVICMDGLDIYEALSRSIPLDQVIIEKARHAASRGPIFKHSYMMLLSGLRMTLTGHAAATFPLYRAALEAACYAYLMSTDKTFEIVWVARNKSATTAKACRAKFASAVSNTARAINTIQPGSGDLIADAYHAAIDFGAHPNPRSIFLHMQKPEDAGQFWKVSLTGLHASDGYEVTRSLVASLDFGLAIAVVLFRALKDPSQEVADALNELIELKERVVADLNATSVASWQSI